MVKMYWLPTHASWLDHVEIIFSKVQRDILTPNDFPSTWRWRCSCQLFAPRRGLSIEIDRAPKRTPARSICPLLGSTRGRSPLLQGVRHAQPSYNDHGACQSVCVGRVSAAALCLCPRARTGADPAKTVRYRPIDTRLDALSGILWGAKTIAPNTITIRTDWAVQRAFGRTGCAEQSTMARTLRACPAANVTQLERVSW
jgi:hypothetical protein